MRGVGWAACGAGAMPASGAGWREWRGGEMPPKPRPSRRARGRGPGPGGALRGEGAATGPTTPTLIPWPPLRNEGSTWPGGGGGGGRTLSHFGAGVSFHSAFSGAFFSTVPSPSSPRHPSPRRSARTLTAPPTRPLPPQQLWNNNCSIKGRDRVRQWGCWRGSPDPD